MAIQQILPGPELAVGPYGDFVDRPVQIQVENMAFIGADGKLFHFDVEWSAAGRIQIYKLNILHLHLPERDLPWTKFTIRFTFVTNPARRPVRLPFVIFFEPDHDIADIKLFDNDWPGNQRPQVHTNRKMTNTRNHGIRLPFGVR